MRGSAEDVVRESEEKQIRGREKNKQTGDSTERKKTDRESKNAFPFSGAVHD